MAKYELKARSKTMGIHKKATLKFGHSPQNHRSYPTDMSEHWSVTSTGATYIGVDESTRDLDNRRLRQT